MLVETVREFIDRDVKPAVREVEHANDYPEAWIEQMKQHRHLRPGDPGGVRRHAGVDAVLRRRSPQELARGWMSLAGAMGGHTVVAKLITLFGTEEQKQTLPAADGDRRAAGHHGADRARAAARTCRP